MSKTYAIGDIHGRFDLLEAALDRIEASPSGGTVVFLGDYVDRGPASKQVLDRLIAGPTKPGWTWVCLGGNHEAMMVGALRGQSDFNWWIGNGGRATLTSFGGEVPPSYLTWMDRLPMFHRDRHRIYVHAGVDPTIPMAEQTEAMLQWLRLGKHQDCHHPDGYIVHGHTPFDDGPIVLAGRCNIDTAAFWSGRLEVAVFDDDLSGPPIGFMTIRA